MKAFLEIVAKDIIRKYGTDLSRIAVVFPNNNFPTFPSHWNLGVLSVCRSVIS